MNRPANRLFTATVFVSLLAVVACDTANTKPNRPDPTPTPTPVSGFSNETYAQALRSATVKLVGTLPTIEDTQAVLAEGEPAYNARIDALLDPATNPNLGPQLRGFYRAMFLMGGTVGPKDVPDSGFKMMDVTIPGQTETIMAGIPWRSPQMFVCGQEVTTAAPGTTVLASTATTKIAAYKIGLRTYGFLNHFECDRAMIEDFGGLACGIGAASGGAGSTENQLAIDEHYATYARVSERLCRNITAYLLPESRRLVA